jgi:outer membrane scaffolding protein for murein synthesis (MipA/OmpV family)
VSYSGENISVNFQEGVSYQIANGAEPSFTIAISPKFKPGNIFVPNLGLNTFYKITEGTSLFANINANLLPMAVKKSPIVGGKNSANFIIGLGYKF